MDDFISNDIKSQPITNDHEADCYMFESDHAALRGNHDYRNLLRTICLLEAQRAQAVKDMETLHDAQDEALKDPILFVAKLQKGDTISLPKPQEIVPLPIIDWENYQSSIDSVSLGTSRHITRLKRQMADLEADQGIDGLSSSLSASYEDCDVRVVRGRVKTEAKSATFNQLWTVEEQKRLEELLTVYPPEEVEAKRWQKVAVALGNRTTQQVASRVQKYFIKLAKAGLPVPGRIPNVGTGPKNRGTRTPRYGRSSYHQHSTFLQAYVPPVYMSDDDDARSYGDVMSEQRMFSKYDDSSSSDESSDNDVPLELRHSIEYQELQRLKALRQQKIQKQKDGFNHHGYKCDVCNQEPIVGTRWHCKDCPYEESVDFCDDCVDSNHETKSHDSSHRLESIHHKMDAQTVDLDYTKFMSDGKNYLDPNFMPVI